MHADLLTQHVFRDLLRQQRPVLYLFRQKTNALGNIPATAVIGRNIQR